MGEGSRECTLDDAGLLLVTNTTESRAPPAAMTVRDPCSACASTRCKKHSPPDHGQQNHQCQACGCQFGSSAAHRVMTPEQRTLVVRAGRSLQLGEGWHSSRHTVHFWNPLVLFQ